MRLQLLCLILLFSACRKQDAPVPAGPATQQEINNWILANMREYYLWNQSLPAMADGQQEPVAFFNSLKQPGDRFSVIYNASNFPRGMLRTFGIDYYVIPWAQAPGGAIGILNFVIPGTKAALNGLKRGDYFTRISNTVITPANVQQLGAELLQKNNSTITTARIGDNGQVTEINQIAIEGRSIVENPLYEKQIWQISGKKVAYLFLNNFDDYYNKDVLQAFRKFKEEGVTELIIDLRYNPGGSVTGSALLSALVAPGIDELKPFVQYAGNAKQQVRMRSFKDVLAVPSGENKVIPFSELAPGRLSLPRVFVLGTGITASSSELLINNLKPYMQVVLIGQTTFGKDVGAVSITDKRIPWSLFPITYKLSNAKGEGGYENGITPQYVSDEKSILPLFPIADQQDPLIAKALSIISGGGRQFERIQPPVKVLYDSRQLLSESSIVILPD
ncbi:hypothetical protein GFS24_13485 [Chitinophaga sp. SYP-B3965]|uniref:S41 family peptidase n=1 Tax=Chitinophaga sp. SYP-B3965 TaxID=2663120 RepID=UPI001299CBB2|nr:S41 family peptidase [Chitinophaga sp. SYP-B3965]MRG46135.1 hypothetical protein [Chitinophaga sp. SYP-B3965]